MINLELGPFSMEASPNNSMCFDFHPVNPALEVAIASLVRQGWLPSVYSVKPSAQGILCCLPISVKIAWQPTTPNYSASRKIDVDKISKPVNADRSHYRLLPPPLSSSKPNPAPLQAPAP